MKGIMLISILLLSGCSMFNANIHPAYDSSEIKIRVLESPELSDGVLGYSVRSEETCIIVLKQYPTCLLHELRHCLEGPWHGSEMNGDYCN